MSGRLSDPGRSYAHATSGFRLSIFGFGLHTTDTFRADNGWKQQFLLCANLFTGRTVWICDDTAEAGEEVTGDDNGTTRTG